VQSEAGLLIDLKLTNDDLAAIAGVSRQFANATLQELRKRGLIAARRRSVVLTQPGGLEKLAYQA
jgi:CRP-like cAMP-binding protein